MSKKLDAILSALNDFLQESLKAQREEAGHKPFPVPSNAEAATAEQLEKDIPKTVECDCGAPGCTRQRGAVVAGYDVPDMEKGITPIPIYMRRIQTALDMGMAHMRKFDKVVTAPPPGGQNYKEVDSQCLVQMLDHMAIMIGAVDGLSSYLTAGADVLLEFAKRVAPDDVKPRLRGSFDCKVQMAALAIGMDVKKATDHADETAAVVNAPPAGGMN